MTNKKAPELRFKGFFDAWEQRKVGDFLSESKVKGSDGSTAKKLTVKLWRKGIIFKEEIYKGSSATQYYIRSSGQFMYGKLDFLNQAFGILPNELDGYESTLDSPAFDFKSGIDSNFFLEYVCLDMFYKYQGNIANGSRKAKRIHVDTFFDMPITIPKLEEQQKIGAFFKQLDDTITLHQRKLGTLKEMKKGFLQQLFPENGANAPKVRFANFRGEWELRKLKEIAKYRNGKAHEQVENDNGTYTIINSKFISTNGNIKRYTNSMVEQVFNDEIAIVLSDLPKGKALAKVFRVQENNKYTLNQRIAGITPNEYTDSSFLSYRLNRNIYFLKLDSGVSQTNLSKAQVEDFISLYPDYEEQIKIGEFFKNFDNIITLHQNKIDKLSNLKKTYLQSMFI